MAERNAGRFASEVTPGGRRIDLDWIRIGAFGLLILYHLAMFFGPWSWHLDARQRVQWLSVPMVACNPWRLSLLFLISGVAVRYMTLKASRQERGPARLMFERTRRLLLPMLFGVLVLVPPQAYFEQVVKDGLQASYLAFWPRFVFDHLPHLDGRWSPPPLNHLWFIGYIWAYSLIAVALLWAPRLLHLAERRLGAPLNGAGVLVTPILYLVTVRFALFPTFGVTNHLTWDPYNHASSLALFLTGFLLAFRASFWESVERVRWPALLLAAAATAVLGIDAARPVPLQHPNAIVEMAAFAIAQWSMIVTVLGFGRRHLSTLDGPALRYLREAVFPFYLLHQTIIIAAAYWVEPLELPNSLEAIVLLAITILGCVAGFEVVRRTPVLGPCLGLRAVRKPRRSRPRPVPVDLPLRQAGNVPATK